MTRFVSLFVALIFAPAAGVAQHAPVGFPQTFADIVEDVIDSVVVIEVQGVAPDRNPLGDLFGQQVPGGTGSGFFIDAEGHIATNEHVVSLGEDVNVVLQNGEMRAAEVLGVDVDTDLAVIKIDPAGLNIQPIEWADSDELRIGDWVIAVGNPLDVGITVTHGIVSALDRDLSRSNPFDQRIQTDAPINSGNSGGPSFNLDAKVIGVNQSIVTRTGGSVGLGFMIPSNVAQSIVGQLRDFGEVRRGFLGITFTEMTDELRASLDFEGRGGVFVEQVFPGLPADNAGIQPGDVLLKFGGREIGEQQDFIFMVASTPPGTDVEVEVFRGGRVFTQTISLTLRETESLASNEDSGSEALQEQFGIVVFGLTLADRLTQNLNPDEGGVRIAAIAPNSPLGQAGLQVGDIIQEVDTVRIFDSGELYTTLRSAQRDGLEIVRVVYLRNGEASIVEVNIGLVRAE